MGIILNPVLGVAAAGGAAVGAAVGLTTDLGDAGGWLIRSTDQQAGAPFEGSITAREIGEGSVMPIAYGFLGSMGTVGASHLMGFRGGAQLRAGAMAGVAIIAGLATERLIHASRS